MQAKRKAERLGREQTRCRFHRFHDTVAFDLDATETLYVSAELARKMARQFNSIAKNIETVAFTRSAVGSKTVED